MAAVASARSLLLRPIPVRSAASRLASEATKASRRPSLRRLPGKASAATASRFLRSPVEMTFCMESLLPMHNATASALMTSMLSVSIQGYGILSEGL